MRILITDGDERSALAATRSLIAAGHVVHVASRRGWSLAGASRGARRCRVGADPLSDPCAYAREIGGLAAGLAIDLILPVTDASVQALLEQREELPPRIILPLPDLGVYRRASDKAEMLGLACAAGLAVPDTMLLPTRAAGAQLPPADFFPAVMRPHRSLMPGGAGRLAGWGVPSAAAATRAGPRGGTVRAALGRADGGDVRPSAAAGKAAGGRGERVPREHRATCRAGRCGREVACAAGLAGCSDGRM